LGRWQILSLVVERKDFDSNFRDAIGRLARRAIDLLSGPFPLASGRLMLIIRGGSAPATELQQRLHAKRGFLGGLERNGSALIFPRGDSYEIPVRASDGGAFSLGVVSFDLAELANACEVTRSWDAVVLWGEGANKSLAAEIGRVAADIERIETSVPWGWAVLLAATRLVPTGCLVIRGFGEFDDLDVSIDIRATEKLADAIEARISASGGDVIAR
jgi:hypothetical protein